MFLSRLVRRRAAVAAVTASLLIGCSDDPGLQERVNRLQAEKQEKERQLQQAQAALEQTKAELKSARAAVAARPAVQLLPREQVEAGYAAACQAVQKQVGGELRGYALENCTQYPVVMPSDESPYHSRIALALRSDGGRSYRLEFPVSADAAGKWTFPTSAEITGALADNHPPDPGPSRTAGEPSPVPTVRPSTPQIVPGQAATETRIIEWGNPRPAQKPSPRP